MSSIKSAAIFSLVTAFLTLALKFTAYFITDSIGLLSDAVESFINVGSGIMLLFVFSITAIPEDENHNYGHHKAEYFAAGVEGCLILVAAITIVYAAIVRLTHPLQIKEIVPGLIISFIATLINFITAKSMLKMSTFYDSVALEANAKHIFTDVWTTACIFLGLIIIYFAPAKWQIIDPIIAILVALHITVTGFQILMRAINGLMDVTLPEEELNIIKEAIQLNLPGQSDFKELRTRKSGTKRFIEVKLFLPGELTVNYSHIICDKIEADIQEKLKNTSITIHVEPIYQFHSVRSS